MRETGSLRIYHGCRYPLTDANGKIKTTEAKINVLVRPSLACQITCHTDIAAVLCCSLIQATLASIKIEEFSLQQDVQVSFMKDLSAGSCLILISKSFESLRVFRTACWRFFSTARPKTLDHCWLRCA